MTIVHIVAGMLAILAGAVALSAAKGGPAHRRYGKVFVATMLVMASAGAFIAATKVMAGRQPQIQTLNVIAGTITFYLVVTAFLTVRKPTDATRWIGMGATLIALAMGLFALKYGFDAMNRPKATWFPGIPALAFGTVALLAVFGDVRVMMARGIQGVPRIARHLWRMCFALFIATGSFFLGQAKVFPEEIRIFPLLAAPVLLVLVALVYWLVRVPLMKRLPQ